MARNFGARITFFDVMCSLNMDSAYSLQADDRANGQSMFMCHSSANNMLSNIDHNLKV